MSKTRRTQARGELELLPIMNLVTILIPMLLLGATFVRLAVVDSSLPAIGPHSDDPPELKLTLHVTQEGLELEKVVKGSAADPQAFACSVAPCRGLADYRLADLSAALGEVKDAHPDAEDIVLVPSEDLRYEVLVAVMDATRTDTRRELFPRAVIAGGA